MCRSVAEGGLRCSAHARARFEAAVRGTQEWDDAAAEFAATRQGRTELEVAAGDARDIGDVEGEVAYRKALERGTTLKQTADDTRHQVQQQAAFARLLASDEPLSAMDVAAAVMANPDSYYYDEALRAATEAYQHWDPSGNETPPVGWIGGQVRNALEPEWDERLGDAETGHTVDEDPTHALGLLFYPDTASSVSSQHFIETGQWLPESETGRHQPKCGRCSTTDGDCVSCAAWRRHSNPTS